MIEINKTYKTKFQTNEEFTVVSFTTNHLGEVVNIKGFYSKNPELKNCGIDIGRLIHEEEKLNLQKSEITIDDFAKVDIRICEILEVVKVPKKDKLYQMKIDTGFDQRIVVSAIALLFTPEDLLGKKVPFVLNLKPRPIAGIESTAMIILASSIDKTKDYLIENQNCETGSILV